MKYAIGMLLLLAMGGVAYACQTYTYVVNNRVVTCTSCCYGNGNCQVNCY